MTVKELVQHVGGPKAFSELTGCPIDTAKKYSAGINEPTPWFVQIIEDWILWMGH